jgi:zinc/manganese transport system substrate-binding protein
MRYLKSLPVAAAGLLGLITLAPATVHAQKLNVVATTPDLAALAREIGGSAVDVKTLAKPTEDPHFVDAKPSHIVTLNRADVLVQGGAELELGWLPPLLESARNKKLAAGSPGHIVATQGIKMLEVPVTLDRSKGDVHAQGNPHYLIDPVNAIVVAENIANNLAKVAPAHAAMFKANFAKFRSDVDAKLKGWVTQLLPHKGAKIVTYHNDFIYFAERFGLTVVETLEPKPGIAPSPAHIAKVIGSMKTAHAHVVMVQPYQSRKTAETVARQTGATVLDVSQQPGAMPNTATYVAMMDNLVRSIAGALASAK